MLFYVYLKVLYSYCQLQFAAVVINQKTWLFLHYLDFKNSLSHRINYNYMVSSPLSYTMTV